jgi:GTP-binding protein Era
MFMTETPSQRCGFIAIMGAPNAGKSTLLNRFVGQKISIVSPRVQTTRTRVLGIWMKNEVQLVFIDTPGVFDAKKEFEKNMVQNAWQGQQGVDVTIVLVDCSRAKSIEETMLIIKKLGKQTPVVCVLNKIDLIERGKLLELAQKLWDKKIFEQVFMISAAEGDGVDKLVEYLMEQAPEQPWHFPSDQVSDLSLRLLAAEITREQLFRQLHEEIPHESVVKPETWQEKPNGEFIVHQIIYVLREGQKAIIIGENGTKIRSIRQSAQHRMEELLQAKVHLYIKVEVYPKWREDKKLLALVGFTSV